MVQGSAHLLAKNHLISRKTCCSMYCIVNSKSSLLQNSIPIIQHRANSTTQNLLHRAVEPLRLPISLRMIRTWHCNFTIQQTHKRCPKPRSEPWIPITNDLAWHSKPTNPILKKQCSHLRGCHSINSRYKNNILGIPVNNSKDPSEPTLSLRQLENKVHGYLLKRLCWNIQRLQ